MKSLVVGLGIGNLYCAVLKNLGYEVDTVDSNPEKNATFKSIDELEDCYDVAVICTPNFTHEFIARTIAARCEIIFIEKPGVESAERWQALVDDFPCSKFILVKNNQYRDCIPEFQRLAESYNQIKLVWENQDRVPQPGSWFTTKCKAFGGVSRDLIPHLLSYFCVLSDYKTSNLVRCSTSQNHSLASVSSTDYGRVDMNGTYDVDDRCELTYVSDLKQFNITADWKTDRETEIGIQFGDDIFVSLGLCPEEAYQTMIQTAVSNLNNREFWKEQLAQDLWIHQQIENL
jgi:predicted dehydrogenase